MVSAPGTQRPAATAWAGGRLFVFGRAGRGVAWDPCTGRWSQFPSKDLPTPAAAGSTEARLDVDLGLGPLGGHGVKWRQDHGYTDANRGLVYDARTKRWVPMRMKGAPPARREAAVIAPVGRRLVVWGGLTHHGVSLEGAVYDLRTRTWRKMPAKNAPTELGVQHVAVSTDRYVVFLASRSYQAPSTGAIYDVRRNAWRRITAPVALYPTFQVHAWRVDDRHVLFANVNTSWVGVLDMRTGTWKAIPLAKAGLTERTDVSIHFTGARLIVYGGWKRTMVSPGGGCEGPRPKGMGCDPMPPVYAVELRSDGAMYRLR